MRVDILQGGLRQFSAGAGAGVAAGKAAHRRAGEPRLGSGSKSYGSNQSVRELLYVLIISLPSVSLSGKCALYIKEHVWTSP